MIAGAQPGACSPSHTAASGPGPTPGGVSDSDRRSGRLTVDHRLAARLLRLSPGRRRVTPIAGDRQLTVSRPAGRAVIADVIRAGGARAWRRGDPVRRRLPVYSPPASGRAAAALLGREEARGLTGPWMSLLHAGPPARRLLLLVPTVPGPAAGPSSGQSAAPPRLHCARARRRAEPGPAGLSTSLPLCTGSPTTRTRPSRPLLLALTVLGPTAGTDPARAVHHSGRRAGPGRASPPTGQPLRPMDALSSAGAGY